MKSYWFLYRPTKRPSTLLVSQTLPFNHVSPTVLKAYAYIAMKSTSRTYSPHLNIITVLVSEGSDTSTQNKRYTRWIVRKERHPKPGLSSTPQWIR